MAVESPASTTPASKRQAQTAAKTTADSASIAANSVAECSEKTVAIDVALQTSKTPKISDASQTPASRAERRRQRDEDEDLARLQDQLMDVLEENQRLRAELDAWRIGARAFTQQNRAS